MKLAPRFIALGIATALFVFAFKWLFPHDKDLIRAQLTELSEALLKEKNENPVTSLSEAQKLKNFFSDLIDTHISYKNYQRRPITDRQDLVREYAFMRSYLKRFSISFDDVKIEIDPSHSRMAYVDSNSRVQWTLKDSQTEQYDSVALEMIWRKIDGDWLIERLATVSNKL